MREVVRHVLVADMGDAEYTLAKYVQHKYEDINKALPQAEKSNDVPKVISRRAYNLAKGVIKNKS